MTRTGQNDLRASSDYIRGNMISETNHEAMTEEMNKLHIDVDTDTDTYMHKQAEKKGEVFIFMRMLANKPR